MDRRRWLGLIGGVGAGAALPASAAADHDGEKATGGPLAGAHAHFCGIHTAKTDPTFQLVTQHYCTAHGDAARGDDPIYQCLLYDSTAKDARLLGVEYIISDARYRALPEGEKKYWHPHAYEVLGGGLVAPGMDPQAERTFMKGLLTTWGKAWHTWPDPTTAVPIGEPLLIWSLGGDGQCRDEVVAARDKAFGVDTAAIAARRRRELGLAAPDVAHPKSMGEPGRMWTSTGEDRPTRID